MAACSSCRAWHRRGDEPVGECRKRAPVVLAEGFSTVTRWPLSVEDAWCLEWERRPSPLPDPAAFAGVPPQRPKFPLFPRRRPEEDLDES